MGFFRRLLLVLFIALTSFLCLVPVFTYISFAADLNSPDTLTTHNDTGITLLDVKGRPFFTFFQAKSKKEIPLSDIPVFTQQAVIAVEDKNFYQHKGFWIPSILRSLYLDLQGKSLSYGGSTITQQLVKNSLLSSKKSFFRKYQEIILASEIERKYSKDQILAMYLNSAYFGENAYGIEQAAHVYFNKKAKDLTLGQSAILAAILPTPSRLSLLNGNLAEAKTRQTLVLADMAKQGFITPWQQQTALKEDLQITPPASEMNSIAPHFALMVKDQLMAQLGADTVAKSDLTVRTTLDLDWQKYAEQTSSPTGQ